MLGSFKDPNQGKLHCRTPVGEGTYVYLGLPYRFVFVAPHRSVIDEREPAIWPSVGSYPLPNTKPSLDKLAIIDFTSAIRCAAWS
jgi:hypothetical protein